MNTARLITLSLAMACLVGCASGEPVDDRYYSLVLAGSADDVSAPEGAQGRLIVGPVDIPRYLSGRGLSMQVSANQIETANHHFWAEPLDEAMSKVLALEVASRAGDYDVERESGRWTPNAACRVRIEFDAFHPTHQARVAVSGRFWVIVNGQSVRTEFSLPGRLTADGYSHAVDVLRSTLAELAGRISAALPDVAACADQPIATGPADQS